MTETKPKMSAEEMAADATGDVFPMSFHEEERKGGRFLYLLGHAQGLKEREDETWDLDADQKWLTEIRKLKAAMKLSEHESKVIEQVRFNGNQREEFLVDVIKRLTAQSPQGSET